MTVAPGFRAVVFALRDLPPSDQRYLTEVAHALHWPPEREPALWDTPLLLVRQSETPPVPDLRSDDEVAASGPSVLLLAMRLLLADALQWPELRFLGLDLHHEAPDYVLYAADPARWTPGSLADALTARGNPSARGAQTTVVAGTNWQVQRGLQPRAPRLPPVPGDRVPVLGLQVPLFGGRLTNLRDLRPLAEQLRAQVGTREFGSSGVAARTVRPPLPAGAVAGHHQGRYALALRIDSIVPSRPADPEDAQVDLTLFRSDADTGATAQTTLRLAVGELSVLHDAEADELTPGALSDWLAELLPTCFLVAPTGEVLLVDWFHLDLTLRPESAASPELTLRLCGWPGSSAYRAEGTGGDLGDDELQDPAQADPALLDVAMWTLPVFADLLAAADLTLSASGRYLLVESALPVDGELTHLSVLIDTATPATPRLLSGELLDEEPPPPAHVTDDAFPALRGSQAAPGAIA